jgi:NAD(P)-dependent dehydrogenase (short-subunit alcohol dehydrogenase family)
MRDNQRTPEQQKSISFSLSLSLSLSRLIDRKASKREARKRRLPLFVALRTTTLPLTVDVLILICHSYIRTAGFCGTCMEAKAQARPIKFRQLENNERDGKLTITQATLRPDPTASLHLEALGRSPGRHRLAGRHIVVVGAGQRKVSDESPPVGIGRAMAMLFAREGAHVACVDLSREAAEETCALIAAEGGKAFAEVADVADPAAIAPVLDRCVQRLGALDGLALNVGVWHELPLAKLTPEVWDLTFAVNVRSHMLFAQHALGIMALGGAITLTSSMASQWATNHAAYDATKAAQIALARSIALAGEPKGIRCNVIAPGYTDTPMVREASRRGLDSTASVPFGRRGTGWEMAYAALFLLSNESSYVNAQTLFVDGGRFSGIVRSPST